MKKFRILWSLMVLPMLIGCSSDDLSRLGSEAGPESVEDAVYMTVTLNPSGIHGTRSETNGNNSSTGGVEEGRAEENAVHTALIILAERDNSFIAASYVDPSVNTKVSISGANTKYKANAQFSRTQIGDYYDSNGTGNINVFIVCNPSTQLVGSLTSEDQKAKDKTWVDKTWDDEQDPIWHTTNSKGFTMTNVSMAPRQLPAKMEDWSAYTKPDQPFNLSDVNAAGTESVVDNLTGRGAIKVHRMAARFDFRDGSQAGKDGSNGIKDEAFTYQVIKDAAGKELVNCKIERMGLTNMSKTEYFFGRVSDDGLLNSTGYELLGYETADNYVVSTFAEEKSTIIKSEYGKYFDYPFFNPQGKVFDKGDGWDWVDCSTVIDNGIKDNYNDKSYYVWRYVTENTIPSPNTLQVNSQSTGVIFKAQMLPGKDLKVSSDPWEKELNTLLSYDKSNAEYGKLLTENADTDPILYSLISDNTIYVSWHNVQQAALAAAGYDKNLGQNQNLDINAPLYKLCFGTGGVGVIKDGETVIYTDPLTEDVKSPNYLWKAWDAVKTSTTVEATVIANAKAEFKKAATGNGFALYQSSQDPSTKKWGYYCYYYYWNRHNDNNEPGTMGDMEFAVVRNNVYKLMVTRLSTLGHPRIPENDPDDPTPTTPDESSNVYMTVSVDVVPWVVRVNDIEF